MHLNWCNLLNLINTDAGLPENPVALTPGALARRCVGNQNPRQWMFDAFFFQERNPKLAIVNQNESFMSHNLKVCYIFKWFHCTKWLTKWIATCYWYYCIKYYKLVVPRVTEFNYFCTTWQAGKNVWTCCTTAVPHASEVTPMGNGPCFVLEKNGGPPTWENRDVTWV